MRVLHVSFHNGCINEFNYVASELNLELEVMRASWNYNIGQLRADTIWEDNKDYFNSFDVIVTSDTGPLSRIFLRDTFEKKLIIWVCNRFDYADNATNDCNFPDSAYYTLFREATSKPNVRIAGYTDFENIYMKQKGVEVKNIIKPTGKAPYKIFSSPIPETIDRKMTFFIPPYHNDSVFMNLQDKVNELGILSYCGRYGGPNDLKTFLGVIHIPYAWSNLALFEMMHRGIPYYVPSLSFLLNLSNKPNFFWSPPFQKQYLSISEWYHSDHSDIINYFDSWEDLKRIVCEDSAYDRRASITYAEKHAQKQIKKWKDFFSE